MLWQKTKQNFFSLVILWDQSFKSTVNPGNIAKLCKLHYEIHIRIKAAHCLLSLLHELSAVFVSMFEYLCSLPLLLYNGFSCPYLGNNFLLKSMQVVYDDYTIKCSGTSQNWYQLPFDPSFRFLFQMEWAPNCKKYISLTHRPRDRTTHTERERPSPNICFTY